jgi:hypothetical protein
MPPMSAAGNRRPGGAITEVGLLAALLVALATGCTTSAGGAKPGTPWFVRPAHVSEPMLTCAQATRAAREALARMGYAIGAVEAARPGVPGKVVGKVDSGWAPANVDSGDVHQVVVTIQCSDRGSEFDAVTDEGFATQLTFSQRFSEALKENADRKVVQPRLSDEPPPGLELMVEPLRGPASESAFGLDLPGAGVTPVKVAIVNRSPRRYRFRRSGVKLVTEEGTRAKPLTPAAAAQRAVKGGNPGEAAVLLQQKTIADAEIPPGGSLSGYLYFDAAAYRRARVVLTDVASDEPEGFSVEF